MGDLTDLLKGLSGPAGQGAMSLGNLPWRFFDLIQGLRLTQEQRESQKAAIAGAKEYAGESKEDWEGIADRYAADVGKEITDYETTGKDYYADWMKQHFSTEGLPTGGIGVGEGTAVGGEEGAARRLGATQQAALDAKEAQALAQLDKDRQAIEDKYGETVSGLEDVYALDQFRSDIQDIQTQLLDKNTAYDTAMAVQGLNSGKIESLQAIEGLKYTNPSAYASQAMQIIESATQGAVAAAGAVRATAEALWATTSEGLYATLGTLKGAYGSDLTAAYGHYTAGIEGIAATGAKVVTEFAALAQPLYDRIWSGIQADDRVKAIALVDGPLQVQAQAMTWRQNMNAQALDIFARGQASKDAFTAMGLDFQMMYSPAMFMTATVWDEALQAAQSVHQATLAERSQDLREWSASKENTLGIWDTGISAVDAFMPNLPGLPGSTSTPKPKT